MRYIIEMENAEKAEKIVEALRVFGFTVSEVVDFNDDWEDDESVDDTDETTDDAAASEFLDKLFNCLKNREQTKMGISEIAPAIIEFYKSEGIEDGKPSNVSLAFTCLAALMRFSMMTGSSIRHFIRSVNGKNTLVIKAKSAIDDSFALATVDPHAMDAEIALNKDGKVYMLSRLSIEKDKHIMKVTSDVFHNEDRIEVTMMRSAIKSAAERFFNFN